MSSLVYPGPPDIISVDQGTNFVSAEMRGKFQAAGVELKEAPVETPGSLGTVKRYHALIRVGFDHIT